MTLLFGFNNHYLLANFQGFCTRFYIKHWYGVLFFLDCFLRAEKFQLNLQNWKLLFISWVLTRRWRKWAGSWCSLSRWGRWHRWRGQPRLRLHIHRWVWHCGVLLSPIWECHQEHVISPLKHPTLKRGLSFAEAQNHKNFSIFYQ